MIDAALSAAYGHWMAAHGWADEAIKQIGGLLRDDEIAQRIETLAPVEHRCHVSRIHLAFLRALQRLRA